MLTDRPNNQNRPPRRWKASAAGGLVRVHGAGDEIRTRDIYLGKVVLYQLSYSRVTAEGLRLLP